MKKIHKQHSDGTNTQQPDEKLAAYLTQVARTINGRKMTNGSLALLAPLAASALMPSFAQAQCGQYTAVINNAATFNSCPDNYIDIDGDGNDDANIFLGGFGTVRIINLADPDLLIYGNTGGGLFYPANVGGVVTPNPASAYAVNGTLFYPGGTANFTQPGGGFIPIVFNGRIGFIQVTISALGCVTVGSVGVHTDVAATSFTAGSCASLPIELINFDITPTEKSLQLSWKTASETNNKGFQIERSTDGAHFRKIGWIAGEGTSEKTNRYAFEDTDIKANVMYYYRLQQVDLDGRTTNSNIVTGKIKGDVAIQFGNIAPNPVRNSLRVEIVSKEESDMTYALYDQLGKLVLQGTNELSQGMNNFKVSVQNVPNGNYYLKMNAGTFADYKKVVIMK